MSDNTVTHDTVTHDTVSRENTPTILLNGTYSWSNSPTAHAWTAMGTSLANYHVTGNTTSVPSYTIQTQKDKSIRPYYRLKIFIDNIKGGHAIANIDINERKGEKEHYNTLISTNILDEEKTAFSLQSDNWQQSRLRQLYKNTAVKNKQMMDKLQIRV